VTRLTTAQIVVSGVASLTLFSGTLSAGFALAGGGDRNLTPPVACGEPRVTGLHDGQALTSAQGPRRQSIAAVLRRNDRSVKAPATARRERAPPMVVIADIRPCGAITEARAAGIGTRVPTFMPPADRRAVAQATDADRVLRGDDCRPRRRAS